MDNASFQILDGLITRFSSTHQYDMDCEGLWECASIDRIAFSLNLWNMLGMPSNDKDFIFALSVFFQPFHPKDMIKDFVHVRDKHRNQEDIKYLNNGLAMPLCSDPKCQTQRQFTQNHFKHYAEMIANGALKASQTRDYMTMIHSYFSHRNGTRESDEKDDIMDMSIINNQRIKPRLLCADEDDSTWPLQDDKRFELLLKAQSIKTLQLLFYNVKRKLKHKDTQSIVDLMLKILQPQIDHFHLQIPLDILEANENTCGEHCTKPRDCLSMKRMVLIMKLYNQINHNMKTKTNDDTRLEKTIQRIMSCDAYGSQLFMDDFNQIKTNHLDKSIEAWEYIFSPKQLGVSHCEAKDNCFIVKRHKRDSDKYDDNLKERQRIYGNNGDSKEVVPLQCLDKVHYFLMHSNYKTHSFPDTKHNKESDHEEKKPSEEGKVKPIPDTDNSESIHITQRTRGSRFNTEIMPNEAFEFGDLFYHWKYYQKKHTYVDPNRYGYRNLKQELLNNKIRSIGLHRWNDTIIKAIIYKYSSEGRRLKATHRGDFNFNRSIPVDLDISIAHMTVILVYTNYEEPQRYFKKKAMHEDLMNNHYEISHFYKLFHEAILFYGHTVTETDVLYHGITTNQLFFTRFHPKFNVPISTTPVASVAKSFCGDAGLLLFLQADQSIRDQYFDCEWCSDFPDEKEYLFAQAHHLFIMDIQLEHGVSNTEYIKAMSLFQDILDNKFFTHSMPEYPSYESVITDFMDCMDHERSKMKDVCSYIMGSFRSLYEHVQSKQIQIIKSEYVQLEDRTRAAMERCFDFTLQSEHTFVKEYHFAIPKAVLLEDYSGAKYIESEIKSYDEHTFTFRLYIKARKVKKISVGVLIQDIELKEKEVHIEWGFRCSQPRFTLSKLREHLEPNRSDAYRAFRASELNTLLCMEDFKELCFTFYIKLLPKYSQSDQEQTKMENEGEPDYESEDGIMPEIEGEDDVCDQDNEAEGIDDSSETMQEQAYTIRNESTVRSESEICRDLFTEIMEIELIKEITRNENEHRKYIKQHMNKEQRDKPNCPPNDDGAPKDNDDPDDDDDKDEDTEDDDEEEMYSFANIDKVLKKVERLKQQRQYKIMVDKHNPLTDAELIALCYYTDSDAACRQMKRYHRGHMNSIKWKQLYFYTTQAIERLYQVFHYKNETQPKISYLFHGDEEQEFDAYSKKALSTFTFMRYTTQIHIALRFAIGSIWMIGNVYNNLYDGTVRGANLRWISAFNEEEFVLLPGKYWNWKKLNKEELNKMQLPVPLDLNVYMTNEYKSDDKSLGTHRNYDDLLTANEYNCNASANTDLQNWVLNNFDDWDKSVRLKYFGLFVDSGCESLDDVLLIDNEESLKQIGVKLIFHRLRILKEIEKLRMSKSQ